MLTGTMNTTKYGSSHCQNLLMHSCTYIIRHNRLYYCYDNKLLYAHHANYIMYYNIFVRRSDAAYK